MSLNQPVGVPYQNPTDYVGPTQNLIPIRRFPRRPLTTDRKYRIGQFVILGKDPSTGSYGELWYLASFASNGDANWVMFDTTGTNAGIEFLETDDGPPAVGKDVTGTVNIFGGTGIVTSGQDPSNTVTISIDDTVVGETITGDSGGALSPTAGNWNIVGGTGISTSGAGSTLTINLDGAVVAQTITGDSGGALSPTAGNWNIVGGTGISTSGAGSTLTINLDGAVVAQTLTGDSGGALSPTAGNWNIVGGTGISTSGAVSTLTINLDGAVVGQTITGDSGGALSPTAGNWNIVGGTSLAGTTPIATSGAVSTLTVNAQLSQALAAADATKVGLANFDSANFGVDADGFVTLIAGGSGALVQQVFNSTSAAGTVVTTMPYDSTTPQITEGTEVITVSITPVNASNILVIEGLIYAGGSAGAPMIVALFQDATADALASGVGDVDNSSAIAPIPILYRTTAGSTSARTYRLRLGNASGTPYWNRSGANSTLLNNTFISYIKVSEIAV